MKSDKIVTINGKSYDATTGMPVTRSISKTMARPVTRSIHSVSARTASLKTGVKKTAATVKPVIRKVGHNMDIARSKSISHFAPKPSASKEASPKPVLKKSMDIAPTKHPLVAKVEKKRLASKAAAPSPKSAKVIKEEAIAEALNKTPSKPKREKFSFKKNRPKFINVVTISIVLILLAGYFTYINMPGLSVRVASAQAGINATYPDYHPDGYSPNGPVTFSDGEVIIRFKANTGDSKFIIKQAKSSWDSSAVRNMVNKDSSGEFATREKNGQTIFTYGNNATWVNGGILYTITGNTRLSTDQILHIATSL